MNNNYLTNIPKYAARYGFSKVLTVRKEVIHIKHIFTEVFVYKSIDIMKYLNTVGMDLFMYLEFMTNRMRKVHHFSRSYKKDCNQVVKSDRNNFFPSVDLLTGFNNVIVLDFDGTITSNNFQPLYKLCCERGRVVVCSANPTVSFEWFDKKKLPRPNQIHAMKGKTKKIKRLIEIQKAHDCVFFIDNEKSYLEYAWLFGINTYHWDGKTIKYFSLKTH